MKKSNRHSDLIISFDADDVNEIYDKKQCHSQQRLVLVLVHLNCSGMPGNESISGEVK